MARRPAEQARLAMARCRCARRAAARRRCRAAQRSGHASRMATSAAAAAAASAPSSSSTRARPAATRASAPPSPLTPCASSGKRACGAPRLALPAPASQPAPTRRIHLVCSEVHALVDACRGHLQACLLVHGGHQCVRSGMTLEVADLVREGCHVTETKHGHANMRSLC